MCWDILLAKRDASGRFVLDAAPAAVFKPGLPGQVNKWATFYACLALARRERKSRLGKGGVRRPRGG